MNQILKKVISLSFVLFLTQAAFPREEKAHSILLIAEPFSLLNAGYDVGVGYGFFKNKIELKYRSTTKSDPNAPQRDDFRTQYKTLELSYNYFLHHHSRGLFIGATANYFYDYKATDYVTNTSATKEFFSLGIRLGYYWYPFENLNLFIDPTLAVNFALDDKDISAGGRTLSASTVKLPPAGIILRIGYRF